MNAYNEELYLEMLQDDGIQHDADNVSEEMLEELCCSIVWCCFSC